MFKRTISATVLSAAVILGISACDSGSSTTVTKTVDQEPMTESAFTNVAPRTTAPAEIELTDQQRDEIFISVIRDAGVPVQDSEVDLIDLAHTMCDAFDNGASFRDVAAIMLENFTPEQGGAIMGAGVQMYCPEYEDIADE